MKKNQAYVDIEDEDEHEDEEDKHISNVIKYPDKPTKALPGSKYKIEVMRQRAAVGIALHHPQDNKFTPEVNSKITEIIFKIKDSCKGMTTNDIYSKAIEILSEQLIKADQ